MKGSKSLNEQPFRYSGIEQNFAWTWDDWIKNVFKLYGTRMRFGNCFVCGRKPNGKNDYPYCGCYKYTKGIFKGYGYFRILCRECAYDYGRGVIEMDGNVYRDPADFNESKYKEE